MRWFNKLCQRHEGSKEFSSLLTYQGGAWVDENDRPLPPDFSAALNGVFQAKGATLRDEDSVLAQVEILADAAGGDESRSLGDASDLVFNGQSLFGFAQSPQEAQALRALDSAFKNHFLSEASEMDLDWQPWRKD